MIWNLAETSNFQREGRIDNAASKADRASSEIAELRQSMERLTLACQAMWELLREHTTFTEEMLDAKMLEVDLRDGRKDGKISPSVVECPKCHRKTNTKRPVCIMCGAPIPSAHKFG